MTNSAIPELSATAPALPPACEPCSDPRSRACLHAAGKALLARFHSVQVQECRVDHQGDHVRTGGLSNVSAQVMVALGGALAERLGTGSVDKGSMDEEDRELLAEAAAGIPADQRARWLAYQAGAVARVLKKNVATLDAWAEELLSHGVLDPETLEAF